MDTISWRRGRRRVVTQSAEQHPHSERVSEAAESANNAFLAKIVLLSLLAHICLVLALVRLDPLSLQPAGRGKFPSKWWSQSRRRHKVQPWRERKRRTMSAHLKKLWKHRTEQMPMVPPARARGQSNVCHCGAQPSLLSMQRRIVFVVLRYPLRRQTALKR